MEINEVIKRARIQKGVTQHALATSLGVSRTTVSNWENGRGMPDTVCFIKMLPLLDLSDTEIDEGCNINYNHSTELFNPMILNAHGLAKLYEYYRELIKDEENLK